MAPKRKATIAAVEDVEDEEEEPQTTQQGPAANHPVAQVVHP